VITFKQFLEVQAVQGAKNHTGPGADTQAGANKAKTGNTASAAPKTAAQTTPARPTPGAKAKPASTFKDKQNADRLEARLKRQNIKYTKTTDKDGVKFEFDDERTKRNADRIASTVVDKTKEDPDEAA
jgi:hypothetical protein